MPKKKRQKSSCEPKAMREIHEIQEKIYEEEKGMNAEEKIKVLHKEAEEARKKYGLKIKKRVSKVARIV